MDLARRPAPRPRVAKAIAGIRPLSADAELVRHVEPMRRAVARTILVTCEGAKRALNAYDEAFASLVNGQPEPFRDFLRGAHERFTDLGQDLGAVGHIVSFWSYRFPHQRRGRSRRRNSTTSSSTLRKRSIRRLRCVSPPDAARGLQSHANQDLANFSARRIRAPVSAGRAYEQRCRLLFRQGPHGRPGPGGPAGDPRRAPHRLRAGRELPAGAGRAEGQPDRGDRLPPGRRSCDDGRGLGPGQRAAGRVHGHPRSAPPTPLSACISPSRTPIR